MNSPIPAPIGLRPRSAPIPACFSRRGSEALKLGRAPVALIVDDCHFVTRRVARALEARGFECVVAANGYAALELIRARHFDLFVLDVDMPVVNGLSVLQQLRDDPDHAAAPVLMLSNEDSDTDREQALELGANGYMSKPLQLRPLYAVIDSIT